MYSISARLGLSEKYHFWVPFWYHFGSQSGPKGVLNGTSKMAPKIGRFWDPFGYPFGLHLEENRVNKGTPKTKRLQGASEALKSTILGTKISVFWFIFESYIGVFFEFLYRHIL